MKTFFVLFCVELFAAVMSTEHQPSGFPHAYKKGGKTAQLSDHANKIRAKLHGHTQTKATFLPSSEGEQNAMLEKLSPEYKYKDYEVKTDKSQDFKITNFLDESTVQELASKHLLDFENEHATRGTPANGVVKGLAPIGNKPGLESLEHLNIVLQNTLPEYAYDRAERGPGFSYDSCVDLDPDCWKYEMDGLCSDSPDLAEKRFNCKKTCHLCVSTPGAKRQHERKGEKILNEHV